MRRAGVSLIELLVAFGLIALMLGLILAAVQKVRLAAALASSQNNLRQLILGVHQLGAENAGRIGGYTNPDPVTMEEAIAILLAEEPPTGPPQHFVARMIELGSWSVPKELTGRLPYLISPADPSDWTKVRKGFNAATGETNYTYGGPTSYAFNMAAFIGPPRLPNSYPDGTAQTIAFAETYCVRSSAGLSESRSWLMYSCGDAAYYATSPVLPPGVRKRMILGERRPSFADVGWDDVRPVTDPATRTTRPSTPGVTFQVAPAPGEALLDRPVTPFHAGLPVALFDGSVRTVRPAVSPELFWGATTPAGGEVLSDW